jgi:hypothetical protein
MCTPDFIIIGAQKGGTTSLFRYLSEHPRIRLPETKEIHYFDLNHEKGLHWYLSHFPPSDGRGLLTGEASPYYLYHPLVPSRMSGALPDLKLIVMLRDPVDRAYSHYHHNRRHGYEELGSFEAAVEMEESRLNGQEEALIQGSLSHSPSHQHCSYIDRGLYRRQIERWLEHYPADRFHFIRSEDFYRDPHGQTGKVCRFLGLDPMPEFQPEIHNGNSYPEMPARLRQSLTKIFREEEEKLIRLIGMGALRT